MAKESGFELIPEGIAAMMRSPATIAALRGIGERGKHFAKEIAPYRDGDFQRSIEADVVIEKGIAYGLLYTTDWRAHVLEKGGEHEGVMAPAFHTFSRATDYMAGGSGTDVHGGISTHTDDGLV